MHEKGEESAVGAPNQGCFRVPLSVHCYPFLHAPSCYIYLFSIPSANQCSNFRAAKPEEGVKRKRGVKGTLEHWQRKRAKERGKEHSQGLRGQMKGFEHCIFKSWNNRCKARLQAKPAAQLLICTCVLGLAGVDTCVGSGHGSTSNVVAHVPQGLGTFPQRARCHGKASGTLQCLLVLFRLQRHRDAELRAG
eukprot:2294775-Rhodomonas_salina.1